MFAAFRKPESDNDVKILRDGILRFFRRQLKQWEGGEAGNLRMVHLYLFPEETARAQYEAAVYFQEPGRFQQDELQRIADDYGLQLPPDWQLSVFFADAPTGAALAEDLPVAMLLRNSQRQGQPAHLQQAFVQVLQGETEQQRYRFDATAGKITIGRDRTVQAADGFHRENKIAFLADSNSEANKFVSRRHAYIQWNEAAGGFQLFADEGGIPPRNKVKVRPRGGEPVKLQSTGIGYTLQDGDQIMLGDAALLEFGYGS